MKTSSTAAAAVNAAIEAAHAPSAGKGIALADSVAVAHPRSAAGSASESFLRRLDRVNGPGIPAAVKPR